MRVFLLSLLLFSFLTYVASAPAPVNPFRTLNGTTHGHIFRITRSNIDRIEPRRDAPDGIGDSYYSWIFTGPDGLEYSNPKLIVTGGTTVYFAIEFETVPKRTGETIMLFQLFGDGEYADTTIGDLNSSQLGLTGNYSTGCMPSEELRMASHNSFVPYNISAQPCILTWKVPNKRPPKLYQLMYRCENHSEMHGLIDILDNPNPEKIPNGSYHIAHGLFPFLLTLLATLLNKWF